MPLTDPAQPGPTDDTAVGPTAAQPGPVAAQPPDPVILATSLLRDPVIEVQGLGVQLGGLPVLRDVDLTVQPGQVVALLGGNGSGKTTLLRAILRLTPHQAGAIKLFGVDQARFRGWFRLGYVPQRASISLHATTLGEIVRTGTLARRQSVLGLTAVFHRRADLATVDACLEKVGLAGLGMESFLHLSGGQQQRALLARALAQQPAVLVLDEPLAGVDLAHQETIRRALERFLDQGGSVLVVLHETDALAGLIDRAVVLRDGRVIHDGALPETLPPHGHEHEAPPRPAGLTTGLGTPWRTDGPRPDPEA